MERWRQEQSETLSRTAGGASPCQGRFLSSNQNRLSFWWKSPKMDVFLPCDISLINAWNDWTSWIPGGHRSHTPVLSQYRDTVWSLGYQGALDTAWGMLVHVGRCPHVSFIFWDTSQGWSSPAKGESINRKETGPPQAWKGLAEAASRQKVGGMTRPSGSPI